MAESSRNELLRKSADRYALAGAHIAGLLDRRLPRPLRVSTVTAIEDTMAVGCYIDAALDDQWAIHSHHEIQDTTVEYLLAESPKPCPTFIGASDRAQRLQEYLHMHDMAGRQKLQDDFDDYVGVGHRLKQAASPDEYAALVFYEGKVAMDIVLDMLPDDVRNADAAQSTLAWCRNIGGFANAVDGFADAGTDVRAGLAGGLRPFGVRRALATLALAEIPYVLRGLRLADMKPLLMDTVGVTRGTDK